MGKNLKINMSQKKFLSRSWPLEGQPDVHAWSCKAHCRARSPSPPTPNQLMAFYPPSLVGNDHFFRAPIEITSQPDHNTHSVAKGNPNRCKSEDCSLQSCLQSSRIGSIRPQASSSHSGQTPVFRFLQHRELRVCICSSLTVRPPPPPTLSI